MAEKVKNISLFTIYRKKTMKKHEMNDNLVNLYDYYKIYYNSITN